MWQKGPPAVGPKPEDLGEGTLEFTHAHLGTR